MMREDDRQEERGECGAVRPLLVPFLDGEASREEAERVEAHIAACPDCAHALEAHRTIGDALRARAGRDTMASTVPSRATPLRAVGIAPRLRLLARRRALRARAMWTGLAAAVLCGAAAFLFIHVGAGPAPSTEDLIGQLEILESFEAEGIEPTHDLVDAILGVETEAGESVPGDVLDPDVFQYLLEEELSPENL